MQPMCLIVVGKIAKQLIAAMYVSQFLLILYCLRDLNIIYSVVIIIIIKIASNAIHCVMLVDVISCNNIDNKSTYYRCAMDIVLRAAFVTTRGNFSFPLIAGGGNCMLQHPFTDMLLSLYYEIIYYNRYHNYYAKNETVV